jgi:hypothetical protein
MTEEVIPSVNITNSEIPLVKITKKKITDHQTIEEKTFEVKGNNLLECLHALQIIDPDLIKRKDVLTEVLNQMHDEHNTN